jgi:hypothetical protein
MHAETNGIGGEIWEGGRFPRYDDLDVWGMRGKRFDVYLLPVRLDDSAFHGPSSLSAIPSCVVLVAMKAIWMRVEFYAFGVTKMKLRCASFGI